MSVELLRVAAALSTAVRTSWHGFAWPRSIENKRAPVLAAFVS